MEGNNWYPAFDVDWNMPRPIAHLPENTRVKPGDIVFAYVTSEESGGDGFGSLCRVVRIFQTVGKGSLATLVPLDDPDGDVLD